LSEEFSHSEQLHPFIEEVLKESGLKSSSLSAIAISKGPGSYTGLRIGVAAAKGLCFALDLPLIALNTLEIMVQPYEVSPYSFIIPMLDARRMEVYTAIFDETKKWIQETMAEVLTENTFTSIVNEQSCLIIGDGAIKFKTLHPKINASYTNEIHYPVAKDMITLAWKKFNAKEFEDLAYFEPFYLKDFQTTPPKK
jgi:tRNA threonylcarbamoyladenosine biosynthesis protein TsaB